MKKMKTTLAIAVALATGVGTSVFAQVKSDQITFALSGQQQVSVSTSPNVNNAGNFRCRSPKYYKYVGASR